MRTNITIKKSTVHVHVHAYGVPMFTAVTNNLVEELSTKSFLKNLRMTPLLQGRKTAY